jgi:hypothetical protein
MHQTQTQPNRRLKVEFNTKTISTIGEAVAEELKRCGFDFENNLYDVENTMREFLRQVGQSGMADFLETTDTKLHEEIKPSLSKKDFYFHSYQSAVVISAFGSIRFKRHYYRYENARERDEKGFALLDEKMGFSAGQVTPSLAELLALEGISTPFEESAKKIEKFLLFKVSENTVRKETEKFGAIQDEIEKELIKQSQDEEWLQKRERDDKRKRKGRIYASVDGFMAPLLDGWKEFRALAWYNVAENSPYVRKRHHNSGVGEQNNLHAENIFYHCDKLEPKEMGELFWATGCQQQADFHEELVVVADGAKWIWNMVDLHYPNATQILDWYHASQYLYPVADDAFGTESDDYKNWIEQSKALLWNGRIDKLIAECKEFLDNPNVKKSAHAAVTFYTNNKKRMEYARFREEGYFIGSGTIESAAKRLGELRLKEAGARWSKDGAVYTAKARAAWLGGQWAPIVARRSAKSLPLGV